MAAPAKVYVDVAGTDRSGILLDVPLCEGQLSEVGRCDIVVSNAKGTYKSSFSKQQRVAVSAARAAFHAISDYFSGSSVAAKWTQQSPGGGASIAIDSNKLKIVSIAANWCYVTYSTISQPFALSVWVKTDAAVAQYPLQIRAGNVYVWADTGKLYHAYNSGGWNYHDLGAYSANTWYRVVIKQTSATSTTVYVYDVNGVELFTNTETIDSQATAAVYLAVYGANTTYFDSYLVVSSATMVGDQLFEGVIDSIEYNHSPDTITLHCLNDAAELMNQYDDTYGRDTGTFTPTYGATDDISAIVAALLPTGWTYTCPDTAIHDKVVFSTGTRRKEALDAIVNHTPYLGWFVLPMKHIAFVMVDTSPAPDAYTEATAGWTVYGTNGRIQAMVGATVDGSNYLQVDQTVAAATTLGARYDPAIDIEKYRYLTLYYVVNVEPPVTAGTIRLRIDTAPGMHYWYYVLPDYTSAASPGKLCHFTVRVPDASGTHGWTVSGAPSVSDDITRIKIECDCDGGSVAILYYDVWYFFAAKKATSKYTVSNIIEAQRLDRGSFYNRVVVKYSGGSKVVDDATCQTVNGLCEKVINDQSITDEIAADHLARSILNSEGFDDTGDPIGCQVVNPGDMYNVVPGDTLTITVANLNLSSATRSLVKRTDTVRPMEGWRTSMLLSNDLQRDKLKILWEEGAKLKRY